MKVKHQYTTKARQRRSRGFTLMEMVLVLAIIGLLVGIGASSMTSVVGEAENTVAKAGLDTLQSGLILYKSRCDMYPTAAQGLQALVTQPTTNPVPKRWKSVLKASAITDPWQKPYQYKYPGVKNKGSFDIYSLGPDGVESEDDIGNWE